MPENIALYLFLGLIFGVIGWILFTLLAKHLKGSIKISLPKRAYRYGEKVTGTFHLHAKKDISCETLTFHLVAYKRDVSYWKDGKKNTRRVEFARFSEHIASGEKFTAGTRRDYDIDITIPSFDDVHGKEEQLDLGDSTLWKLASYALNRTTRMQLSWQVQVDLVAEGLDIHGKKDIFVTNNS